jgi:hypothetical protein
MPRLSKIGAACLAAFGWTSGAPAVTASYLVVAGGGGGGAGDVTFFEVGGGGGAGGYLESTTSLNPTLSYTVTVGAGGAGVAGNFGTNGSNSSLGSIATSTGGGYGGGQYTNGNSGGSGGGGGGNAGTGGGSGTVGQGNNGGSGTTAAGNSAGGGGGGAGAVGGNASSPNGGNGGNGTASSITGSSVTRAGGGGGSRSYSGGGSNGSGGSGGGGAGGGTSGTSNTGSGGGANFNGGTGGRGGSGVVIISYPSPQKFGGGVVTTSGANTIHTFTTSGTLSPLSTLSASYLVVAGGGGGGYDIGAGAGAGGLLTGSGVVIDTNSTYVVTVGAGGDRATSAVVGSNGSNSVFSAVSTAAVGGGGGASNASPYNGASGGSGGGGAISGSGAAGTSGQGNAGGNASGSLGGGGGGGASAVGANGTASQAGAGGAGSASSISGSSVTYAGGGGAGGFAGAGLAAGAGGAGGGGAGGGSGAAGTAGTANLGGGGGGGGQGVGGGGNGGSGIVIISYAGSTQLMAGGTVTISGGNVIHTFNSSGYLTPLTLVGNSLRFRASATGYLSRTPPTAGNRKTWTFSAWIKRGSVSNEATPISGGATTGRLCVFFNSSGQLISDVGGTGTFDQSTAVYRDPAAWYHFVWQFDTTQATAANRSRMYMNGVAVALTNTRTFTQNADYEINNSVLQTIGTFSNSIGTYNLDGYMTEINFIDGQALTPNSFGTFNQYGVWQPIRYGGSYGTNGFYLPMNPGTSSFGASLTGSNYLTTPNNAAFAIGTGDFTMETWFYPIGSQANTQFLFVSGGGIQMGYQNSSTWGLCQANVAWQTTTNTLPTQNAWNHMAITRSGTTVGLFMNGVRLTTGTISTNYSQNACVIGQGANGFMSNTRMVKGTAVYNPANATYTVPTAPLTNVSGTSLLTFQNSTNIDNSSNVFTLTPTGTVADFVAYPFNLGTVPDYGPAGNNWTANNIQPIGGSNMDVMTDVPTLTSTTVANYCTLTPLWYSGTATSPTLTNGNLLVSNNSAGSLKRWASTMAVSSGKFYFEYTRTDNVGLGNYFAFGVTNANSALSTSDYSGNPTSTGATSVEWALTDRGVACNTSTYSNLSGTIGTVGQNAVVQVCIDMDNKRIWFGINNTFSGSPTAGTGAAFSNLASLVAPILYGNGGATTASVNFGQQPFVYTPPTGFLPLNTFNL